MQPLAAPAGGGKTRSLQALRAAAHRANKEVLVLAPTGKAVDEAMREAGDRGLAKALALIEYDELAVDRRTVMVVDEASRVGTPDLQKLLAATTAARTKVVLVGDPYQLSPVKRAVACSRTSAMICRGRSASARSGGCTTQKNALRPWRCGAGPATGCAKRSAGIATMADCTPATPLPWPTTRASHYLADRDASKDSLLICDTLEMADALNRRLHGAYTDADYPSVWVTPDQDVRVGDIILTRHNDALITVHPGEEYRAGERIDQVREGNRWRVAGVHQKDGADRRRTAQRQSPRRLPR